MKRESGFRALLVLGAAASVAIGVWAILGPDSIHRLYGATLLSVGVGYAIAAVQPQAYRGLLVVLFLVPGLSAIVQFANVARGDVPAARGIASAVAAFVYCLLYFRVYPRMK